MKGRVHFAIFQTSNAPLLLIVLLSRFFRQLSSVSQCNGYRFRGPAWLAAQLPPTVCLLSKQHRQAGEPQLTQSSLQTENDIRSLQREKDDQASFRTRVCPLPFSGCSSRHRALDSYAIRLPTEFFTWLQQILKEWPWMENKPNSSIKHLFIWF